MDRINELLGRITELSQDELGELRGLTAARRPQRRAAQAHSTDSYAAMEVLASAVDSVKHEPAVKGSSRCRMHGAKAPQVLAAAERQATEASVIDLAHSNGVPRSISAIEALAEELHRTQGHVDWLERRDPGRLNVYQSERAHPAKLSQQMVALLTDERQNVLNAQVLDSLETALNGIVRDLGHDPSSSYVRRIIARRIREVSIAESTDSQDQSAAIIDAEVITDEPAIGARNLLTTGPQAGPDARQDEAVDGLEAACPTRGTASSRP